MAVFALDKGLALSLVSSIAIEEGMIHCIIALAAIAEYLKRATGSHWTRHADLAL